jgi:transcriptional antiterminator RfaH
MRRWFVAKTQTNRENWAAENILRQLAVPYLPKMAERIPKSSSKMCEMRTRLVFPGYVFVHTLDGRWRFLLGTYGISSVIMVGNEPAVIHDSEILRLKSFEDADGLTRLPTLPEGEARFKHGEAVRVIAGQFIGLTGIYDGCTAKDRERILLDYLGGKTKVLLGADQITKAEE